MEEKVALSLFECKLMRSFQGQPGVGRRFLDACKNARYMEVAAAFGLPCPRLDEMDATLRLKYQTMCNALKLDHSAKSVENSYRIQNFFLVSTGVNSP